MNKISFLSVAVLLAGSWIIGCKPAETKPNAVNTPTAHEMVQVKVSDEAMALLAEADKLDGKEDKVITHCYTCGLGMNGKDDICCKVGPYTAHFCSDDCCAKFEETAEEMVKSTEIPKP